MLRKATNLKGYHLGAIDGEIGQVKEFYFDDETWTIRYLVADTGKWLAHRKVLIAPHAFGPIEDEGKIVHVLLTREQVEESPSIDADKPVSRQFEEKYLQHFGWPLYWSEPLMWNIPMPELEKGSKEEKADPHLRSMSEVIGYHIQARDGEIGHLEDLLLNDMTWEIRDIIVETRNWLPGKRVLVSPEWIRKVSWEEAKVFVNLNRSSLREFPEYEDSAPSKFQEGLASAYNHDHLAPLP